MLTDNKFSPDGTWTTIISVLSTVALRIAAQHMKIHKPIFHCLTANINSSAAISMCTQAFSTRVIKLFYLRVHHVCDHNSHTSHLNYVPTYSQVANCLTKPCSLPTLQLLDSIFSWILLLVLNEPPFLFKTFPFNFENSLTTFQRVTDFILATVQWQLAIVYNDDTIVCSTHPQQHLDHLEGVMRLLKRMIDYQNKKVLLLSRTNRLYGSWNCHRQACSCLQIYGRNRVATESENSNKTLLLSGIV